MSCWFDLLGNTLCLIKSKPWCHKCHKVSHNKITRVVSRREQGQVTGPEYGQLRVQNIQNIW